MNKLFNPNSKYTKIYRRLIDKAICRVMEGHQYSEKHHIVPKSLGGKNTKENVVRLSGREHYIAHLLLWKSFPPGSIERKKMAYAANQMRRLSCAKINSRTYEQLKKEHSKNVGQDKIGNKNCVGLSGFIKNINTGKITRIKVGERIPTTHQKWKPKNNKKLYYYDPTTDKEYRFARHKDVTSGLLLGRSISFREKVKKTSMGNSSNRGKMTVHNPTTQEQKRIGGSEKIPMGFVKGSSDVAKKNQSISMKGRLPPNTGKHRYHNPKTNKIIQILPTDDVPLGFLRGMPKSFSEKTKSGMKKSDAWSKELIRRRLS